jgi:hypothetical protein
MADAGNAGAALRGTLCSGAELAHLCEQRIALRCVACRQGKHVLMVFTSNGVLGESGEQTGWCFPCVLISLVPLL